MKRLIILLCVTCPFLFCGTPRTTETSKISSTKVMKHNSQSNGEMDSVVVTGTQTIPLLGKNEAGTRPDIEGIWVLESMPGAPNGGKQDALILKQKEEEKRDMSSNAEKRDSVTSKTANGSVTTTTVYTIKDQDSRITPPQSSNLNIHKPEAPRLSFFGSNGTFAGFTGCNKISGRFSLKGNTIAFQNANPSFKMACIGEYDESAFLSMLRKVNSLTTVNGRLQLMEGDKALMVFSRK